MKTTPEERAVIREELRAYGPGDALLDDLDEALAQLRASHEVLADLRAMTTASQREVALLAEVAALRAVAEAARTLLGRMADGTRPSTERLRAALRAWEERER